MNDPGDADNRPVSDAQLLRLIIDSAHDYAIFSVDRAGLVTSWNSGAERVLGWGVNEILHRSADVIFTSEDRAACVPEAERAAAIANGRAEDERWQMRKNGSRFWASGLMMPLEDSSLGFIKILRDRTHRHLAEEKLRESEERFRLLALSIPQLVFRTLSDGTRTWPSPQWTEFTGLSAKESLGYGWLDAIHPDDRELTLAGWQGAAERGEYSVEHRVQRRADGQYRWHQTRARPVRGTTSSDADWVGTMTDVHDIRGLQERQKIMMAELQHRTRNLLAIVQAIVTQTLRSSGSLQDFKQEFDSRLRALGRVQALITGVDYANVDLRDLLTAELEAQNGRALSSGKVELDGPAVPLTAGSAQALGLALHELVTNAAKYGALKHDAGRLSVTWRLEQRMGERRAILEWKESGVALQPAVCDRRYGYGRELVERALPYQLGAETAFAFEPDGVRCKIEVVLEGERDG